MQAAMMMVLPSTLGRDLQSAVNHKYAWPPLRTGSYQVQITSVDESSVIQTLAGYNHEPARHLHEKSGDASVGIMVHL